MKCVIILLLLLPIALLSRPPLTSVIGHCADGFKSTITYIDSNNNGIFDKYVRRNCSGPLVHGDIKYDLTGPAIPTEPITEEEENNDCSQSGVTIDYRLHILDSNLVVTHEAISYCGNDTLFVSEYTPPPLMNNVDGIGTLINLDEESTFLDPTEFFDYVKKQHKTELNIKFDVIFINKNIDISYKKTFYANPVNIDEIFNKISAENLDGDYIITIDSNIGDYIIDPSLK